MSKASKKAKAERKAMTNARKITPQKLFRLVLKSLGFAIIVYIIAYPFLMSEFRPRKPKKG